MTYHRTPLSSEYEFDTIKAAPGPEKYSLSLFATKMSCFQSCRGLTPASSTSPYFNNTDLSPRGGFLYSEENTINTIKERGVKTLLLRKIPVVKQQKGILQQFTNWILRSY